MYTISRVAARTGLSVATIRAWERRYGVVRPSRTPAGYRLYDDASIARLLAMRRLIDADGWRPSQAAEHVLAEGKDSTRLGAADGSNGARRGTTTWPASPADLAVAAFLAAAERLDVPAMGRILDEAFASQRFEAAMDAIVFPALRAIGEGWSVGAVDAAVEHAASETVRRRLAHFHDAVGRAEGPPRAVVGLPPGGYHEIGAFAFAVAARRAGLDVLYLGANVPLESWLRTVRETGASLAVLGVVTAADAGAARLVVEALGGLAPPPRCFLGGPSANGVPVSKGTSFLPASIDAAVAAILGE